MIRQFQFAQVVNIVDGDTCDIEIDLGFSVKVKHRFRLARINTPERGRPGFAEATEYLKAATLGKPVVIDVTKLDKYGRYLAEIFVGDQNINDALLEHGHAVLYA